MIHQIHPPWRRCKTMKRDRALRCPPHTPWVPCSFSDWLSSNSCAQNLCYKCLPIKFIPALYWLVLKFFSKVKSKFTWAEVFQTHSWLTPGAVVRMVETLQRELIYISQGLFCLLEGENWAKSWSGVSERRGWRGQCGWHTGAVFQSPQETVWGKLQRSHQKQRVLLWLEKSN